MSARVLVIEDDPNILISIDFLLRNAGYTVTTASDGAQGWVTLQALPADLLVLDIMLPTLDGFEICRRVRATPALHNTRIMLLSAHGHNSEIDKGMQLGANAYLRKPFGTREFLDTVARLIGPHSATANPAQLNGDL